ncbi:hypothetical protein KAU08_01325, partial [bacterium]|nr:hypothetical protein [bacterium]
MRFTVFFLLLLFLVVSAACDRGNNKLMVGSIKGPIEITENSSAEYKIDAHSDTGITYSWISNPVDTGSFSNTETTSTIFTSPEVETDYPVVITVVVNSDNDGPVIRSLDVIVKDVPDDDDPPEPQNNPPQAAAHFEQDIIAGWHTFQFTDNSTDPDGDDDIVKWEWDFSFDESDSFTVESEEQNPLLELGIVGTYQVMLRVTDASLHSDLLDVPLQLEVGNLAVTNVWGTSDQDKIYDIEINNEGDAYVLGRCGGTVDFNGDGEIDGPGSGYSQEFLAKFTGGEDFEWVKTWNWVVFEKMCILNNGDLFILSNNWASHYPAPIIESCEVLWLDPDGNVLGSYTEEAPPSDNFFYSFAFKNIQINPVGNVAIATSLKKFDGEWYYDFITGEEYWIETYSEFSFSLIEFSPDLDLIHTSETWPGNISSMAVSNDGNIYTVSNNQHIQKVDSYFQPLWTQTLIQEVEGPFLTTDSYDNMYLTGQNKDGRIFLGKYNSESGPDWSFYFDSHNNKGTGLDVFNDALYLTGELGDPLDLDPGEDTQFHDFDALSACFVAKFYLDGVFEDGLTWGR